MLGYLEEVESALAKLQGVHVEHYREEILPLDRAAASAFEFVSQKACYWRGCTPRKHRFIPGLNIHPVVFPLHETYFEVRTVEADFPVGLNLHEDKTLIAG